MFSSRDLIDQRHPGGSLGTFSCDALFLFENFQTDILQGTAEG